MTPDERDRFWEQLRDIFEGVKVCLCFVCSHQPDFGPCSVCGCRNLPYADRIKTPEALPGDQHQ